MSESEQTPGPGTGPGPPEDTAVLVVDHGGTIRGCTADAVALLGVPAEGLRGTRTDDLFVGPGVWQELRERRPEPSFTSARALLRRASQEPLAVRLDLLPVEASPGPAYLMRIMPVAVADQRDEDDALVRAMFAQSGMGIAIHDTELRVTRANPQPGEPDPALPQTAGGPPGQSLRGLLVPEDGARIEDRLRQVAGTGEALIDFVTSARLAESPGRERSVSVSALPLRGRDGTPHGVAVTFMDVTEQEHSRWRSALVAAAASRLGQSLDVRRNAEVLTDLLVPEFADLAAVDLTETVLVGKEPGDLLTGAPLLRVAAVARDGPWPTELYPLDAVIRVQDAESDLLRAGSPRFTRNLADLKARVGDDDNRRRLVMAPGATSFMVLPLHARGRVLGVAALWRTAERAPFDEEAAALAEDIGSRAALAIDNARRYTREHRTAEALQRSLLPQPVLAVTAADTAGFYVPGRTAAGTGGSWYDVITLSSTQVALVVGTVVGHGLDAAAAMGRLQTAVRTLADLDPAPDELLTHLDDLVVRLAEQLPPEAKDGSVRGATCLYAVYDPVSGRCSLASAGHPAPLLAPADGGAAHAVKLPTGAALGLGGALFEPIELDLAPGDVLAFPAGSLAQGDACDAVARRFGTGSTPGGRHALPVQELGQAVLAPFLSEPPDDDAALLVARVRASAEGTVAAWEYPADMERVAEARSRTADQLARWGLDELTFTTELIVSELVTNAMRYAGGPVLLRLIKDQRLICEVSDTSQTQPHLRRARLTDEGGRGLFLVAALTHRWGSRYTASGKTIWTEQLLEPPDPTAPPGPQP
ncbi:SpoIIE family protein phosphatase [Streptomyces sp. H39-S7]|uniref:SpoIIE family protein phosphatase n=1 Tax=Streptomyces sp. H39-S7 TaxID=3004357 RepID=UPI0022AEC2A0|nr:SpoIIE family protein phosphatase [Streptomyces sp. H39-S7]MCZ4122277.1 SpoIIE family protein phosphatase [Streptomyces sp. H39-S7]